MERKQMSNGEISRLIEAKSPIHVRTNFQKKVKDKLIELGADKYNLSLPESHFLPFVIDGNETILGIVYGRYSQDNDNIRGRGLIIATNLRVILLDKKPQYLRYDELSYTSIRGAGYTKVLLAGTVSLHTSFGNIRVRTFNSRCSRTFVLAVERFLHPDITTLQQEDMWTTSKEAMR